MHLVERGQFETLDDLQTDERSPEYREAAARSGRDDAMPRAGRSRSRARAVSEPRKRRTSRGEQRPLKEPTKEKEGKENIEMEGPEKTEERRLKTRPNPPGQEESRKKKQKEERSTEEFFSSGIK